MLAPRYLALGFLLVGVPAYAQDAKGLELFEKKIRPVLIAQCYECHASDGKAKGGLVLDHREGFLKGGKSGPSFVAGRPDDSLLLEALRHDSLKMPPKTKLSKAVIEDFAYWIKIGAPDPREKDAVAKKWDSTQPTWVFQKPIPTPAPAVKNNAWPKSDVDRHILAKLEEKGIVPNGDADPRTLIRRLSFDLVGLPPTPAEADDFLAAHAKNPKVALEDLIDRLLGSPHFGERWGRHWLDVAHYAENSGVVKYGQNYPYAHRYRDWVIAAFNNDMPYDAFVKAQIAGDLLPAKTPEERERLKIGTGFLVMGRLQTQQATLQVVMDNIDEQIDALSQGFLGITISCARCHDHKFDPISTKDYYALAGIFRSTAVNLGGGGGAKNAGANKKNKNAADLPQVAGPFMGVADAKVNECNICIRGDVTQLGERVDRNIPAVFGKPLDIKSGESGRLQLAHWIANADNPLTARVMANRIWQHLFGRGLVPTPDNFGSMSEPCSNPELLNHLALRLIDNGWSVKKTIRELVLSRAYQLDGKYDEAKFEKDPENFYLWRRTLRRLDAESIRDSILLASGQLDAEPLKGSVAPPEVKKKQSPNSVPEHNHRSVYLSVVRENVHEMMRVFDFADPSLVFGKRDVTTIPTQALFMMNNPFVIAQSDRLATRILNAKSDDPARVALAFELVLSRQPTSAETQTALAFLAEHAKTYSGSADQVTHSAWRSLSQSLFQSAEFRYVR